MNRTKIFLMALVAVVFSLAGCGDNEIYFTTDEIVGDIITGKQVRMDNSAIVTMGVRKVNVQNAKGNVTATPSDVEMAEIETYKYQNSYTSLYINLKKEGKVTIVVKDEDGHSANLYFTVHAGGLLQDSEQGE